MTFVWLCLCGSCYLFGLVVGSTPRRTKPAKQNRLASEAKKKYKLEMKNGKFQLLERHRTHYDGWVYDEIKTFRFDSEDEDSRADCLAKAEKALFAYRDSYRRAQEVNDL